MEKELEKLNINTENTSTLNILVDVLSIIDETKKRKDALKLLEKLKCLEGEQQNMVVDVVRRSYTCKDMKFLWKVSAMLEISVTTRRYVGELIDQHLEFINYVFSMLIDDKELVFPNDVIFNEHAVIAMKVCLQSIKFLPEDIKDVSENDDRKELLVAVFCKMLQAMYDKRFSKECCLLGGTAFGLLFNLFPDEKTSFSIFNLLQNSEIGEVSCDHFSVSSLKISMPSQLSSPYARISLINGLTSTGNDVMLMKTPNGSFLFHEMFVLLTGKCLMTTNPTEKYLCFQTIYNWLKFFATISSNDQIKSFVKNFCFGFLNKDSLYMTPLLDVVKKHIDDLVDGIPQYSQKIFSMMLLLHDQEKRIHSVQSDFILELCHDFFQRPWHVKSRWSLVVELIPYIGFTTIFNLKNKLVEELLLCLETCGLPAVSNEVYQCLMKDIKKSSNSAEEALENWTNIFLDPIMKALQDENVTLRLNVGQHWIPSTFRLLPNSLVVFEKNFCDMLAQLPNCIYIRHSFLLMLRNARCVGLVSMQKIQELLPALEVLIQHSDLDVRLEAFCLLCTNPKKTEPLPECFQKLILTFITNNLNCDSSKFRQQMFSLMKKLFGSIRDSSVVLHKALLKSGLNCNNENVTLDNLIDFIDDIIKLSKSCLRPSSLYQRKKIGLQLLELLTHMFVFVKNKFERKKGAAEDSTYPLFEYIQTKQKWKILSTFDTELLFCIEDQHDEIRDLSLSIMLYQQRIAQHENLSKEEFSHKVINIAHTLLDSPKFHEAESGATLFSYLVERSINNPSITPHITSYTVKQGLPYLIKQNGYEVLFRFLLFRAKYQFAESRNDFLQAACEKPIYGYFLAIAQCFKLFACHCVEDRNISECLKDFLDLMNNVRETMMELLSGEYYKSDIDREAASPSFADIDKALDKAMKRCRSYAKLQTEVGHLHCGELLISFCWLNMKALCLVMASLGSLISQKNNILNVSHLKIIMDFYQNALIKCRHKGVIEAAYASLGNFVKSVSGISNFWIYLKRYCIDIMEAATDLKMQGSVTKRSAGIPMFVQAIISGEPPSANFELLHVCMDHLFNVALTSLPTDVDISYDLPQFNAINILRAIFRDNSLGNVVLKFVDDGLILTINGFSSPSWSIRNASTLLLGTLVPRMLGQRLSQQESSQQSTITVDVFFYRYPKLQQYFLGCFEEQVNYIEKCHSTLVLPNMMPVLTFLSKLRPTSDKNFERILHTFLLYLNKLRSSSVYPVRDLVTSCILVFTRPQDYLKLFSETLQNMVTITCKNSVHSNSLLAYKIMLKYPNIEELYSVLWANDKLLTECNEHLGENLIPASVFTDLLHGVAAAIKTQGSITLLASHLKNMMKTLNKEKCVDIGKAYLNKAVAKAAIFLLTQKKDILTMKEIKSIKSQEFRYWFLSSFCESIDKIEETTSKEMLNLCHEMLRGGYITKVLEASLSCLCMLLTKFEKLLHCIDARECFRRLISIGKSVLGIFPVLIPLLSMVVAYLIKEDIEISKADIDFVAQIIFQCSLPENDENLRLASAKSLFLLDSLFKEDALSKFENESVSRLLWASVSLLQDEDEAIREHANQSLQFVNCSNGSNDTGRRSYQCSITLRSFFTFVQQKCCVDDIYLNWLINHVMSITSVKKQVSSKLMLFEQESSNLYAEETIIVDLVMPVLQEVSLKFSEKVFVMLSKVTSSLDETFKNILTNLKEMEFNKSTSIYGIFGNRQNYIMAYKLLKLTQWLQTIPFKCDSTETLEFLKQCILKHDAPEVLKAMTI